MNTVMIIGACLLGSSVLQLLVFSLYSNYHKRRLLRSYSEMPLQSNASLKNYKQSLFKVDFVTPDAKNAKATNVHAIKGKAKAGMKLYTINQKVSKAK